jgi:DNA-binding NtrC family response regulator
MEQCGGSKKKAAGLLGISSRVLCYKLSNMRKESGLILPEDEED